MNTRQIINETNIEYDRLSRFLHRLALGSNTLKEVAFDLESIIFFNRPKESNHGKHMFISGLARSGTTSLLNFLYDYGQFASLNYADMPFILCPNLWQKISPARKNSDPKERAHGDGIFIHEESVEALDEVFWKMIMHDRYIKKNRLEIQPVSEEMVSKYAQYIDLILLKNDNGRKLSYLSKNNNHVLRLHSLSTKFSESVMVVPFRDPLQHALSLLNQHRHFLDIHQSNRFSLAYMNWIGHHEFGANQKPFFLGNENLFSELIACDKLDINYWLLTWLNYYLYVFNNQTEITIFCSFERYCKEPEKVVNVLLKRMGMDEITVHIPPFEAKLRSCQGVDELLLNRCREIYHQLDALAI